MDKEIEFSFQILTEFRERCVRERSPSIDRAQVVAHATLSALAHHWPSRVPSDYFALIACTNRIKETERSRWMVQRRIAIAKIARFFEHQDF